MVILSICDADAEESPESLLFVTLFIDLTSISDLVEHPSFEGDSNCNSNPSVGVLAFTVPASLAGKALTGLLYRPRLDWAGPKEIIVAVYDLENTGYHSSCRPDGAPR